MFRLGKKVQSPKNGYIFYQISKNFLPRYPSFSQPLCSSKIMSELVRGLISVGILVLVISIVYLVIQNYKESKLSDKSNRGQNETKTEGQKQQEQQQDAEAKLQAEKDKVDTLVDAMENNTNKVDTSSGVGSPF